MSEKKILEKIYEISKNLSYFKKDTTASAGQDKQYSYVKGFDIALAVKIDLEEKKLLAKFSLNASQASISECVLCLTCLETGESHSVSISIPTVTVKDFRFYGAQFSYLKRLCFMAMFNITIDEMDISETEFSKEPLLNSDQLKEINAWVSDAPNADRKSLLMRHFRVSSLSEIERKNWTQIQSYLKG